MIFSYLLNMQSHPSWVCGLKQNENANEITQYKSHPSWVCGLKLLRGSRTMSTPCHTLRGCVD